MNQILITVTLPVSIFCYNNKNKTNVTKQISESRKELKEISGISYCNKLIYNIEESCKVNEVTFLDNLRRITKTITLKNTANIWYLLLRKE